MIQIIESIFYNMIIMRALDDSKKFLCELNLCAKEAIEVEGINVAINVAQTD